MIEIEEPKIPYRKKKDGNISKAEKKSKHKHIYDKTALFFFQYKNGYTFDGEKTTFFRCNEYCSICGKIGDSLPKWGAPDYWDWIKAHTLVEWLYKYPNAKVVNLGEIHNFYDIQNINEVTE
jgi:hypothetical protein